MFRGRNLKEGTFSPRVFGGQVGNRRRLSPRARFPAVPSISFPYRALNLNLAVRQVFPP